MSDLTYEDLTLERALELSGVDEVDLLARQLFSRTSSISTEHDFLGQMLDRWDGLYYTTTFTEWGADLWPDDPSATTPGRSHISLNTPKIYVDIPAALQAVAPIERMLAVEDTEASRKAAQKQENLRKAWKVEEKWQLKRHKAAVLKGLYGLTHGFVYFDQELDRTCAEVIHNPRNVWIGYTSNDYEKVEWAAHVSLVDPTSLMARYSVDVTMRQPEKDVLIPWVVAEQNEPHPELTYGAARIEVWDYWYRKVKKAGKPGKPSTMSTWNVVIAGNQVVSGPYEYKEYKGRIPYLPLFNTFVPNAPTGRSELHDMEPLIREMMTRLTSGAQMIKSATDGQYWQLTGPEAPSRVSAAAKPKLNEVAAPGAGNRIEPITPFIAQFQWEQYMGRLDRFAATISGLNDLLLGLAPAQALSSSKAVNALIANYEARLSLSRLLFYEWDRDIWNLVLDVEAYHKKDTVGKLIAGGIATLDIVDPSLSPRDEMDTAQRAVTLMNAKVWSQERAMDAVGVDDPSEEKSIIREESTDSTLWPDRVMVMAQVLSALQQSLPQATQDQAQQQLQNGTTDLQSALGASTAPNTLASQEPGDQGVMPTVEGGGNSPFAQGPEGAGAQPDRLQSMVQGGKLTGRLLSESKITRR